MIISRELYKLRSEKMQAQDNLIRGQKEAIIAYREYVDALKIELDYQRELNNRLLALLKYEDGEGDG